MPSSKKLEEIKSLLPLYLKGFLSKKDSEEVNKSINDETILKKELEFWDFVNKGYNRFKRDLPDPPEHIYSKIVSNLKKKKQKKEVFFNFLKLNPKFSFILIFAEFLIIVALIFYIFNLKYEYKTLSVIESRAETDVTLNVVLKENATEKEIRELLTKINGRIIDGPSKTGLYVISIKDKENKDKALDFLRKSNIVFFVEPTN